MRSDQMPAVPLDVLQRVSIFDGLPRHELDSASAASTIRRYEPDDVVFDFGARATHFFGVTVGYLKVSTPTEDGREVAMGVFGPGEAFGEPALLVDETRAARVAAVGSCVLVVIGKAEFEHLIDTCPTFARRLLSVMASRTRQLVAHHTAVVSQSVEQRLANKIMALAKDAGNATSDGVKITPPLSQQDLAELVSTTRQSVNKQLRAWVAAGYLTVTRGSIVVVDSDALPTSTHDAP